MKRLSLILTITLLFATISMANTDSLVLTGNGTEYSQWFHLEEKLYTVEMTHSGESNFIVWLVTEADDTYLLSNEIGAVDESGTLKINSAGMFLIDVEADGEWTISLREATPEQTDTEETNTEQTDTQVNYANTEVIDSLIKINGNGTAQSDQFFVEPGLWRVVMIYDGESNFKADLLDESNQAASHLSNMAGPIYEFPNIKIDQPGLYSVSVETEGNWNVELERITVFDNPETTTTTTTKKSKKETEPAFCFISSIF